MVFFINFAYNIKTARRKMLEIDHKHRTSSNEFESHSPQSHVVIGESDLRGFTEWWESRLPSWLVLYCIKGEAKMSMAFKPYTFKEGMATIIPADCYPEVESASEDFKVFYIFADREFVNQSLFDIPRHFYDAIYIHPILPDAHYSDKWKVMLESIFNDTGNIYLMPLLSNLFRAYVLDFYDKWRKQFGDPSDEAQRSPSEKICIKFYDLVFDHYREERRIAFYAKELCITSSYLAVVLRKIGGESPKEAIDRQVTMDIKYMLRNTNMNNKEIAEYMHFPDTSYMCRYFRRQTGKSPSEYRNAETSELY